MDRLKYHIIYVNRNAREDRIVRAPWSGEAGAGDVVDELQTGDIGDDLRILLKFNDVRVCKTGASCLSQLFQLHESSMLDRKPTVVLIDTPHDEQTLEPRPRSRSASPHSRNPPNERQAELHSTPDEEVYGLKLLQRILTEAHVHNLSKLVVPIPVISYSSWNASGAGDAKTKRGHSQACSPDPELLKRCVDLGAADVVVSPINTKCLTSLSVLAYRAHKEAAREQQAMMELRRGRKLSWVGVNEEKPFAYLREAMVSGLMKGICRLGGDTGDRLGKAKIAVPHERQTLIASAVGDWHFCAHDFTDDELLFAGLVMFRHALSMPALEKWRIPTDQLINFLVACRASYNTFVPYHNFRHVVDVVQATFHFLVSIGALAPYPLTGSSASPSSFDESPIGSLLSPFEGLTLLVTAVGHDVGHPGVNNGFLITLNAPLAQLYNDRSVLESFHCAAFSQILRRHWPSVFEDIKIRKLMISSILSTDMGLHFDYMKKLSDTQTKLRESGTTEGWDPRMIEEQKALACSLLIKCADISNVARKHETALQWMYILSDEFSRQAAMETELGIPSSLLAPPKKDATSLFKSQLGFMNLFAIPLFQGVADIMPAMKYTVDELQRNKDLFELSAASRRPSEDPQAEPQAKPATGDDAVLPSLSRTTMAASNEDDTPKATILVAQSSIPNLPTEISALSLNGDRSGETDYFQLPTNHFVRQDAAGTASEYKEVNGISPTSATHVSARAPGSFDAIADFAASDPFNMRYRLDSFADVRGAGLASGKPRSSEATDGGNSVLCSSGDWTSQATSATTGKMPLSPSTQGTSVGSRESLSLEQRRSCAPMGNVPEIRAPKEEEQQQQQHLLGAEVSRDTSPVRDDDSASSCGSIGKHEGGGVLKKKPSRFRMNAFNLFRRNKNSNGHLTTADTPT